jgi:hypothetical protein
MTIFAKNIQLMCRVIIVWCLLFFHISFGQTYIKANAATALVLIPNVGIETSLSPKFTFQTDVMASFWKSFRGGPLQFVTVIPEIRYHFKENYKGFYCGANIGGGAFKLQKWNYAETKRYQEGYNYFIGATIGYQKKISDKIMLEVFLGGGNQQAFYKGYDANTGLRYETADNFNKSGEWIPYRGGFMVCYKLN